MASSRFLVHTLLLLFGLILLKQIYSDSSPSKEQPWNWHQKYIGRIKRAVFHTLVNTKKRVLVTTEQNLVASLNIRNGQIIWREVLGDNHKINGLDTASGKYVITLSGSNTLRAWSITNGKLVWETYFPTFASAPTLDVTSIELHHLKAKMTLVFGGQLLYGVSSADGVILWKTNTANASQGSTFSLRNILTGEDNNSLYGVGFVGTSGFCIWKVYLFTGRLVMQEAATIKGHICTDEVVVTKHTVVALDCEGKTIFTGHIGPVKSFSIHMTPVMDVVPDAFGRACLRKVTLEGIFLLRFVDQIVFIMIGSSDHDLKILEIFGRPAIISNSLKLPGTNVTAVMVVQHVGPVEDCQVAVRVVMKDGEKGETLSDVLELDHERGLVQQVHFSSYVRKDKSWGFRALLVMEDQSTVFVQNGRIAWTREDGLATVLDVVSVELPEKRTKLREHDVAHVPKHGLQAHFQHLMALFTRQAVQNNVLLQDVKDRSKLLKDVHGFRKLLVLLTKGGKLYALHTGTGKIVWSLMMPSFLKFSRKGKASALRLLSEACPLEQVMTQNPVVLMIANTGVSKAEASGLLVWVDCYTGTELHSVSLLHAIEDTLLDWKPCENGGLHMLMDVKNNIHVFPVLHRSMEAIKALGSTFTLLTMDMEGSVISGYGVNATTQRLVGMPRSCTVFNATTLWKIDFSKQWQKVIATSIKMGASPKAVCDERYSCGASNRTLMFIATAATSPLKVSQENSSGGEINLMFYVIDVATGELLYKDRKLSMQAQVHVVNDGGWFTYLYFDLQDYGYKCSFLGIYCPEIGNTSTLSHTHAAEKSIRLLSSEACSHSQSLKTMTAVQNSYAHDKQLLMGTADGQIILSNMAVRNGMKQVSKHNAFSRWMGHSRVPLQSLLTKTGTVEGLRKIVFLPTKSSSAGFVFAYGVDIFLTRVELFPISPSYLRNQSIHVLLVTIAAVVMAVLLARACLGLRSLKKPVGKNESQ